MAVAATGPDIKDLKPRQNGTSSQVFASDGTRLGFIQSPVVRQPISSEQIPEDMRNATVAVEDRRFYQHKGVDFEGVVRAALSNITSGQTVQGGSTLTMQLIKNLYAGKERNLTRKIREAKLAESWRTSTRAAPASAGSSTSTSTTSPTVLLAARRSSGSRPPRGPTTASPPAN